jgi:hypothetical protein
VTKRAKKPIGPYAVLQCGSVVSRHSTSGAAQRCADALNAELVDELGPDADLGDGAASVAYLESYD